MRRAPLNEGTPFVQKSDGTLISRTDTETLPEKKDFVNFITDFCGQVRRASLAHEIGYDRRVIRRLVLAAFRAINFSCGASRRQGRRRPNVINAPTAIARKAAGSVIPPAIESRFIGTRLAHHVAQSPCLPATEKGVLLRMKHHGFAIRLRVKQINVFRRNIVIAAQGKGFISRMVRSETRFQSGEKIHLIGEFRRRDRFPVWNVNRRHPHAVNDGGNVSSLGVLRIAGKETPRPALSFPEDTKRQACALSSTRSHA